MPPARQRNVDDSRSETSSTLTNQKDKSVLGPTSASGVSKGKRAAPPLLNGSGGGNKAPVIDVTAPSDSATQPTAKDPSLPRVCPRSRTVVEMRLTITRLADRLGFHVHQHPPHLQDRPSPACPSCIQSCARRLHLFIIRHFLANTIRRPLPPKASRTETPTAEDAARANKRNGEDQ